MNCLRRLFCICNGPLNLDQIWSNWSHESFRQIPSILARGVLANVITLQTTQTRTYKKRKLPDLVFLKGTGSQKRRTRMDAPFVKGLKLSVDLKIRRVNEQPSLYQDIPDSVAVDLMRPFAPQSTYINPSLNQNGLTFFRSSLGAFLYNRFPPFVQSIF